MTHTKNTRICVECGGPVVSHTAKRCRACYTRPRPLIDNGDGTHTVPLTRGAVAIIDSADAPLVAPHRWQLNSAKGRPDYASTAVGRKMVYLHRLILGAGPDEFVDHIDRNTLNCRRENLRLATPQQNMANVSRRSTSTSPYKGVARRVDGKAWVARIQFNGKGVHLGSFTTAAAAARAYDRAAVYYFGEFAGLNFPDEYPGAA